MVFLAKGKRQAKGRKQKAEVWGHPVLRREDWQISKTTDETLKSHHGFLIYPVVF